MRSATACMAFFSFLMMATTTRAVILQVGPGQEYSTIQSAINAANEGDVVQVAAGEYVENIVLKSGVDVTGAGAEETTVRSWSESFPMAAVEGADNTTVQGLTITGGYYGVRCSGVSPTVTDCVIWRNAFCGILMETSNAAISRSVLAQNPLYGVQCTDSSAPSLSNCTFSANGYAVSSSSSSPTLINCILWDNWDDLEGVTEADSVSYCDIEDADYVGENGNISTDPRFVGWSPFNSPDNELYVDTSHVGDEEGSKEKPFTAIASALSVYSYHLGLGSPCLNAGDGGVHMGAYPHEEPSRNPGGDGTAVNVAAGTYYEGRLFACHGAELRGPVNSPATLIAGGATAFFGLGQCSIQNFIVKGGDDAIACYFSQARIENCVITESGQNGIYLHQTDASVDGCHLFYNFGAGVLLEGGTANIVHCLFGQHAIAGISCIGGGSATIHNCLLTDSPVGVSCAGGATVEAQNATVTNAGWKGIEATDGGAVTLVDCIVWGNPFGDISQAGGTIEATFSNIGDELPGEGNINANPLFEQGPLGDFYIDSDSPCVNSGSDTAENLGLDSRTTSPTGEPDTGTVDMGFHYERFEVRDIALKEGQLTLIWNSTPGLDYSAFRASSLAAPVEWERAGELTASWTRAKYSLDETSGDVEFYGVSHP